MRLRHIKNSENDIYKFNEVICNPLEYKGKYKNFFNNLNPIELEIGIGKGDFLIKKALANPNTNYIGIEKYATVLLKACEKLSTLNLKNIKLMCVDAINVDEIFEKEISKLYLNFSDPWPKKRHEKRRLTSKNFLDKYQKIFMDECLIQMKTDNLGLFEYSLQSFENNGYKIIKTCYDYFDEYTSEYEEKFISKKIKINYLLVSK